MKKEAEMKPDWQQRLIDVNERFLRLARAKGNLLTDSEVLSFLALAICGEAGELANLVKKLWRGDEVNPNLIRNEIADIRIYLEHISSHLGINLDQACDQKLDEVVTRLDAKERSGAAQQLKE